MGVITVSLTFTEMAIAVRESISKNDWNTLDQLKDLDAGWYSDIIDGILSDSKKFFSELDMSLFRSKRYEEFVAQRDGYEV